MSDIMIHVSSTVDTPQEVSHKAQQKKRERKKFLKKMKKLKEKGCFKDNPNQRSSHKPNQTSNRNGPFTRYPPPPTAKKTSTSPHFSSSSRGSHSSSGPSISSSNPSSMTFTVTNESSHKKPKQPVNTTTTTTAAGSGPPSSSSHKLSACAGNPTKYLAIDCEMVGAGPKGSISQLARCSIVSYDGDVVYDKFIKPSMPVTDYRTRWSGIRPRDLFNAPPYAEARKEVMLFSCSKYELGIYS